MKIVGLMPVRNEDWVLGLSARAALMWCDELVILDHASTDGTKDILEQMMSEYDPERIMPLWEEDPQWDEMRHRHRMLEYARVLEATHIALIDADEVLTGNMLPFIRDAIGACHPKKVLQLPWLCLRDDIEHVHSTGQWAGANVSVAFKDSPELHWAARNGYDFHHRHPMGRQFIGQELSRVQDRRFGLMHLQFCSWRRLRAKQALYQMTEILRWPDRIGVNEVRRMYNNTVRESHGAEVTTVPDDWWSAYGDLMQYLNVEAEPWQEAECMRLMKEHGPKRFEGLNLFGVCG